MAQDEDFGSLSGGLHDPWDDSGQPGVAETDDVIDRILDDGDDTNAARPPGGPLIELPEPQPVNQATMVCLRGPCIHYWELIARYETSVDGVSAKCHRTCVAGISEMNLGDQNIYECDRWWPRAPYQGQDFRSRRIAPVGGYELDDEAYAVVYSTPVPQRELWREPLERAWLEALEADGYDFSWREDYHAKFVADDEHGRKYSGPGGAKAAREAAKQQLPPPAGVPTDADEKSGEKETDDA